LSVFGNRRTRGSGRAVTDRILLLELFYAVEAVSLPAWPSDREAVHFGHDDRAQKFGRDPTVVSPAAKSPGRPRACAFLVKHRDPVQRSGRLGWKWPSNGTAAKLESGLYSPAVSVRPCYPEIAEFEPRPISSVSISGRNRRRVTRPTPGNTQLGNTCRGRQKQRSQRRHGSPFSSKRKGLEPLNNGGLRPS
jgi:hypothetical protein